MRTQIDAETKERMLALLKSRQPRGAVDLICDWWNRNHDAEIAATHFGIFVAKNGEIYRSLTPDDPDERTVTELEAALCVFGLGSAYIEFRYDELEDGVRHTFNMDGEAIDCASISLESYLRWNTKAISAWWEVSDERQIRPSAQQGSKLDADR